MDEKEIAEGCLRGEDNSRRLLYETYSEQMLRMCYRCCPNTDDAEDLLHNAFVKIYSHIDTFRWRGNGSLKAWVLEVQRNCIIDYLKSRKRLHSDSIESVADNLLVEDTNIIVDTTLQQMIDNLPEGYKKVVNLFAFEGKTHTEIAQELGIKPNTSSSKLSRARKMLVKQLDAKVVGCIMLCLLIATGTGILYLPTTDEQQPVASKTARRVTSNTEAHTDHQVAHTTKTVPTILHTDNSPYTPSVEECTPSDSTVVAVAEADTIMKKKDVNVIPEKEMVADRHQEPVSEEAEVIAALEQAFTTKKHRGWDIAFNASDGMGLSARRGYYVYLDASPELPPEEPKVEAPRPDGASGATNNSAMSFGISLTHRLSKRWSLETGLSYALLNSDLSYEDYKEKLHLRMHYLGIPINANFALLAHRNWRVYLSGGGMVERCLNATLDGHSFTNNRLQWSVGSSVGVQYNFTDHWGIYFEPGARYYFPDGSNIKNLRTERPFIFHWQLGVRFSIGK